MNSPTYHDDIMRHYELASDALPPLAAFVDGVPALCGVNCQLFD